MSNKTTSVLSALIISASSLFAITGGNVGVDTIKSHSNEFSTSFNDDK